MSSSILADDRKCTKYLAAVHFYPMPGTLDGGCVDCSLPIDVNIEDGALKAGHKYIEWRSDERNGDPCRLRA